MRKHFFNELIFESIDTEEKAYWLGFISADVSVNKTSQWNSYRLSIGLNPNDVTHLMRFKNWIGANDVKIEEIKETVSSYNFGKYLNGINSYRITLNSKKMCNDLITHGVCIDKTHYLELTKTIPDNLMRHFIRGFSDGDGSFYFTYDKKNKRYRCNFEIVGGSKNFIFQLKDYLDTQNIHFNVYQRKNRDIWRLVSSSFREISKFVDYLYLNSNIYLDRKYEKALRIKICHLNWEQFKVKGDVSVDSAFDKKENTESDISKIVCNA